MESEKTNPQSNEVGVVDCVVSVLSKKKTIIKLTFFSMVVATGFSLLLPSMYLAETKVLPPQNANASMATLMATQMGFSPSVLGVKTPNDLYLSLLKTKGVLDFVIDRHDLMKVFKAKSRERARHILASNLLIKDEKRSGLISIGVYYKSPKEAADIANSFVDGLQNVANNLAVTEAAQRRLFFEEQLKGAKENLIKSEENLKYFQQRTGTIKIDDEARAVIGTVAEIRAKISSKEVQSRVMKSYATSENPDLLRLQDEIGALKEELRRMESKGRQSDNPVPNVGKMSVLSTEYVRYMREFRYNESLYEILIKQFEAAKLDESKDAALLQIVERAEPPESRIKPQRRKMIVNTGAIVFVLSIVFVFLSVYFRDFASELNLRGDLARVRMALGYSEFIREHKLDDVFDRLSEILKKRKI